MTEHITVSRELLRQVLEPIERATETAMHQTMAARIPESGLFGGIAQDLNWAATELRAALEQPAVEPVAWLTEDDSNGVQVWLFKKTALRYSSNPKPLYTAPTPSADVPLLTVEEIINCLRHLYWYETVIRDVVDVAIEDFRAVEQAVRQKAGLK